MSDAVTIGALAASALAMAAEAMVKGAVGEAIKDAYKALKDKVALWIPGDIKALEKNPTFVSRQRVIAEVIDTQPPDDQAEIKRLASALNAALHSAPNLVDIEQLEAERIQLNNVSVRIREAKTREFNVGNNVGKTIR
jgi:hypothetical protein